MTEGIFRDPESALRSFERIESLTGITGTDWTSRFEGNPDPDLALMNLERWLLATGSPRLNLQQVLGYPKLGNLLIFLMGAAQPVADALIQNPELASLVFDAAELGRRPTVAAVIEEGERLLSASTSYQHSLDRLRFLRQRWNLTIVLNDLAEGWAQEDVWRALSDLAEALVHLSVTAAWREFRARRPVPEACPVSIVAFGKLGGSELNYSSDIDLAYVLDDGADEDLEREATRFCEFLGRALTDKMGRGSLYRVDLRLRPFGAAGPILKRHRAFEAYYRLYAEPWENQALLRSRVLVGSTEVGERWEQMVQTVCFSHRVSEVALEQMLSMRARIEGLTDEDDLKRGPGGIRDVEFLVQILQLVHGHREDLNQKPTLTAIQRLAHSGILSSVIERQLVESYSFLRKLEHRVQLVHDQQTHALPSDGAARDRLGRLMGDANWGELSRRIDLHRRSVQTLYRSVLNLDAAQDDARGHVQRALGPAALQWFDVLPESEAFYRGLRENEGSLDRVRVILERAPVLVPTFKGSLALTELLFSGEIEEPVDPAARVRALPPDAPPKAVAALLMNAQATLLAQFALGVEDDLGPALAAMMDALVDHVAGWLCLECDVVGLGSYGNQEMGPNSDLDLLFLVSEARRQAEAETQVQQMLAFFAQLHRLGAPAKVDLRLRPDGGKGLLVRTYEGFRAYELAGMESWERFALGHARQVRGDGEALETVLHAAYGPPLTPERLRELAKMKRRVETERVKPQHVRRDIKLGHGGLSDIEWLVHLTEMRYPTASRAGTEARIPSRIRQLARARLINALECEQLLEAHGYLLAVRNWLYVLGFEGNVLPENPDKLMRLAHACGAADANAFLARHEAMIDSVRQLFTEALERLKA